MEKVTLLTITCLAIFGFFLVMAFTHYSNLVDGTGEQLRMSKRAALDGKKCTNKKRLLIVSFDGFRWNYLNRTQTPHFDKFIHNGVQARYGLKNAFTTVTFPNHITLVTGLWEESHNILANNMYDPLLNETFREQNASVFTDSAWFDAGGEPVWVTNQLKGNSHSGVIMWLGGRAAIHKTVPTKDIQYDPDFKNETKIETMIDWLKNDCQMNLGLIYFPQPDLQAHKFGPESKQVTRMIGGLDNVVGYLLKRFKDEGFLQNTNIILTSDHGFAATPLDKRINLDEIVDPQTYQVTSVSPVTGLWPHQGYFKKIYENLTRAAADNGHFLVYKKEDIPEHFHYKNSRRTPPIIVVANEFYSFQASGIKFDTLGDHGYDNRLTNMHPFFLAMGPDFKSGFAVDSFRSVDVYPLMCHLLQIEPSPNNGTMDIVSSLLKPSSDGQDKLKGRIIRYVVIALLATCLFAIVVGGIIFYVCHYRGDKKEEEPYVINDEEDAVVYTSDSARVPLLET